MAHKYLKISNQVEIEVNAFHLIGACTKRGDNSKIGYFGSGLKYAIATLLRERIPLKVYSGVDEIHINYTLAKLRDQEFEVICINGDKTSLTTSMGPTWEIWQALREIYCNALDENECAVKVVDIIEPVEGETAFYVEMDDNEIVQKIYSNWDKYFTTRRPALIKHRLGNIHTRIDRFMTVYRKGVRAYNGKTKSIFDYDFHDIAINESRLIQYEWYMHEYAAVMWAESATADMIETLVKAYTHLECVKNSFEHNMSFSQTFSYEFNENWTKVLGDKILIPMNNAGSFAEAVRDPNGVILSHDLIIALKKFFGDDIKAVFSDYSTAGEYMTATPTPRATYLLKECLAFLEEVGIEIKYPILIAYFDNKEVLGHASDNQQIVLADTLFDRGKKMIVATILEEHMHLDSRYGDETRGFQDYIINQMITMLENKHGMFL